MSSVTLHVGKRKCVYLYKKDGEVFYVGCGTFQRPFSFRGRNQKWKRFFKGEVQVEIVQWFRKPALAHLLEEELIKKLAPPANIVINRRFFGKHNA